MSHLSCLSLEFSDHFGLTVEIFSSFGLASFSFWVWRKTNRPKSRVSPGTAALEKKNEQSFIRRVDS